MAGGWRYTKLSLSSVFLVLFIGMCFVLLFLSFCRFWFFLRSSHWSFIDVPLIVSCPADHAPDCWQPRLLLGKVEAQSLNNVENTRTRTNHEHKRNASGIE